MADITPLPEDAVDIQAASQDGLLKRVEDLKLEIKGVRGTQELCINELQTQREANGKLKKRIEELETESKRLSDALFASHYGFCKSTTGKVGGKGCDCAVTSRAEFDDLRKIRLDYEALTKEK